MLNFRLNTLKQYVDYFVIIEFAQNFMFESKDGYLDFEKISEEIPKEKIIHLKIPSLTLESVNAIYLKTKIKRFLIDLEKDGLNKTDFIKVATIRLKEFLTSIDFIIDDLIMLSDVDEIPDFRMIDEIKKRLIYGPVFLKNKNFIWSDSFCFQTPHEGNVILNFSHLVINDKVFIESINSRNVFRGRKNTIKCGWHFSHFYDINRTLKKLRVLHPEKFITQELLIESLKNLEYPLLNDFGVKEKLIENEEIFPFPTKGLPKTFLGRKKSKKNLILFDENTSIDRNIFDCVFEIKMENKFLPKKVLYGNYSEKEFEKVFVLNDVPKILKKSFPLNQDIFYFIFDSEISQAEIDKEVGFIDSEKRFAIFDWETMKKNILSDLVFGSVS